MDDLQHQPIHLPDSSSPVRPIPSTQNCTFPIPINADLPGQIPTDETPQTTEPNYPQPSTSHSCPTIVLPIDPASNANKCKTQNGPRSFPSTSNITSRVDPKPSNSTPTVPLGNVFDFYLQDQTA